MDQYLLLALETRWKHVVVGSCDIPEEDLEKIERLGAQDVY